MPSDVTPEVTDTCARDAATPTYTPDSSSATAANNEGLQQVIQEWPNLPPVIRAGIMAMARATLDQPEAAASRE